MKIIQRMSYISQLESVKNIPDIKVITGIRRSGKSKLLDAFSSLISKEDNSNVVRINLNQKQYKKLLNADNLYEYIEKQHVAGRDNYLFIDEIQLCDDFEQVINSIYDEELYDIYLTGSNAFLLSSDLATLFGGRVFEINMFPFSFSEYLNDYFAVIAPGLTSRQTRSFLSWIHLSAFQIHYDSCFFSEQYLRIFVFPVSIQIVL